jgi:hypothetical protein
MRYRTEHVGAVDLTFVTSYRSSFQAVEERLRGRIEAIGETFSVGSRKVHRIRATADLRCIPAVVCRV